MAPGFTGAPPPQRRSRARLVLVVILVVVVLIVAFVAVSYFLFPAPPIQVGAINIWAPDNVCGLNANPIYFDGYNGSTGASQTLELGMPNFNTTGSCTIVSMTTNTSGFALSGIQVPLIISANGTGSMNVTITSPTSSYTGDLNLIVA